MVNMIKTVSTFALTALFSLGLSACFDGTRRPEPASQTQNLLEINNPIIKDIADNISFDLPLIGVNGTLCVVPKGVDLVGLDDFCPGLINFSNIQDARAKNGPINVPAAPSQITSKVSQLGLGDWRRQFVDMRLYKSIKMSTEAWARLAADIDEYVPMIEIADLPSGALVQYVGPGYLGERPKPMSLYANFDGTKIYYIFNGPESDNRAEPMDYAQHIYKALLAELSRQTED